MWWKWVYGNLSICTLVFTYFTWHNFANYGAHTLKFVNFQLPHNNLNGQTYSPIYICQLCVSLSVENKFSSKFGTWWWWWCWSHQELFCSWDVSILKCKDSGNNLPVLVIYAQVRVCREKTTGHVYAMKKLKKSEMLRRGQVCDYVVFRLYYCGLAPFICC